MEESQIKTKSEVGFAIYHDLVINSSLSEVFQAVSEPNHLINWWPKRCTGNPEIGSDYNFYFALEYDWHGKVTEYLPNTAFYVKMTKSDSDWDPTTFGFDLEELEGGVQVKFWHIGWPECNAHYRTSSFCWAILLNGLKKYVEKGEVIPFEERE